MVGQFHVVRSSLQKCSLPDLGLGMQHHSWPIEIRGNMATVASLIRWKQTLPGYNTRSIATNKAGSGSDDSTCLSFSWLLPLWSLPSAVSCLNPAKHGIRVAWIIRKFAVEFLAQSSETTSGKNGRKETPTLPLYWSFGVQCRKRAVPHIYISIEHSHSSCCTAKIIKFHQLHKFMIHGLPTVW